MAADKFNLGELAFELKIDLKDLAKLDDISKGFGPLEKNFAKYDKQTRSLEDNSGKMDKVMRAVPFLSRFYAAVGSGGALIMGLTSAIAYMAHVFRGGTAANAITQALEQTEDALKSALTLAIMPTLRDGLTKMSDVTKEVIKEVKMGPGEELMETARAKGLVDFGLSGVKAITLASTVMRDIVADRQTRLYEDLGPSADGVAGMINPLGGAGEIEQGLESTAYIIREGGKEIQNAFTAVANNLHLFFPAYFPPPQAPTAGDSSAEFFGPLLPSGKYFTRTSAFRPNLLSMGGDDLSYKRMRG